VQYDKKVNSFQSLTLEPLQIAIPLLYYSVFRIRIPTSRPYLSLFSKPATVDATQSPAVRAIGRQKIDNKGAQNKIHGDRWKDRCGWRRERVAFL